MEGIFALKPRYDADSNCHTVWAKLATDLPEPVFVANLRFNDRGRYVFGKIPYEKKDVKFWDGDIEEKDFWKLPVTSYAIGGIENGRKAAAKKTDFKAIVDTGASSLHLPSEIVQNYYAKVPGHIQQSGQHLVPSGQALPDLVLYIGEESYPVRILGKFLQPQGPLNELFCLGRLEESTNPHVHILGHPFFFAQNVIFKGIDVLSVGLVKKGAEECC
ncbi:hypothetical protein N7471_010560 [Penicillium samsonianum]|uniref:uncharacterized protein n=1 Tax=Penicillium samsonianum TaxID=1882272 RepID=UPI002548BCC9|nr:uncharacterized protein N7471_010560 [Penicillium samsonianum]KAJ6126067.1 hypothetical protein N7471_010560 [Penicillium samsonianum]